MNQGIKKIAAAFDKRPQLESFLANVDMALEWATERLDKKLVWAMEHCINEDPNRQKEIKFLKGTVMVLVCVGLGIAAVCM